MRHGISRLFTALLAICVTLQCANAQAVSNPSACLSIDKQIRRAQSAIKKLNSRYKSNESRVRRATVLLNNRGKAMTKYLDDVTARIGVTMVELAAMTRQNYVAEPYALTVEKIIADPTSIDKLIEMDTVTWKNSSVRGIYLVFGDYANGMGRFFDGCPKGPYSGQAAYVPENWGGCYDCTKPGPISKSQCTLFGQSISNELDGLFGKRAGAPTDILQDRESWLAKANDLGVQIFNLVVDRSNKAKDFVGSQQGLKLQQIWKEQNQLATTIGEFTANLAKLKETKLSCNAR